MIKNNKGRKGKKLWTGSGSGDKVVVYTADSEYGEAEFVSETILSGVQAGAKYSDFAVLYRMNAQSSEIEKNFAKSGIPYKIVGGLRFFDRREIKDMIAYLSVINNPSDTVRLKRIINEPKRGIGDATVDKAEEIANGLGMTLYEVLCHAADFPLISARAAKLREFTDLIDSLCAKKEEGDLLQLAKDVMQATGYYNSLAAMGFEGETKIENLQELLSTVMRYCDDSEDPTLEGFLEEVALITDLDNYDDEADAVVMMTLHAAKGLEFPTVFIPGMEDGIFPGRRSLYDTDELEEERRLCYVGITRAKKNLYLIKAKHRMLYGSTQRNPESCFLKELPESCVEYRGLSGETQKSYQFETDDFDAGVSYTPKPRYTGAGRTPGRKRPAASPAAAAGNYQVGQRVHHKAFGDGMILSMTPMASDILMEVAFDKVGTKKIMANYAKLKIIE